MTELIVAMDVEMGFEARSIVSKLEVAGVRWFKFGVPALLSYEGLKTIEFARACATRVMLDIKLYDTRDTVRRTLDAAAALGVAMVTVHAGCVDSLLEENRFKILAVRRLTDGTGDDLNVSMYQRAHGFVCSVGVARRFRPLTNRLLVCPGIRPEGSPPDNHEIRASPRLAAEAGVDFIVVGRPIVDATDPVAAARRVLDDLAGHSVGYDTATGTPSP